MEEIEDLETLNEWLSKKETEIRSEGYRSGLRQGKKEQFSESVKIAVFCLFGALATPIAWNLEIKNYIVFSFTFFFIVFLFKSIFDGIRWVEYE